MLSEKDYTQIEAFLGNQMTPKEASLFENRLKNDKILKKEFELYKLLNEHLFEQGEETKLAHNKYTTELKSFLETEEAEIVRKKIKGALEEPKKVKPFNYYWAAAVLIIFISIGGGYLWPLNSPNNNQIFNSYYSIADVSVNITRGSSQNWGLKISTAFKEKKYEESLDFFEKYSQQEVAIDTSLFLIVGASHLELEEPQSAINSFKILANSELLDKNKGEWFLALSYIKNNNLKKAELILNGIENNKAHYKNKEAAAILKKLEGLNN